MQGPNKVPTWTTYVYNVPSNPWIKNHSEFMFIVLWCEKRALSLIPHLFQLSLLSKMIYEDRTYVKFPITFTSIFFLFFLSLILFLPVFRVRQYFAPLFQIEDNLKTTFLQVPIPSKLNNICSPVTCVWFEADSKLIVRFMFVCLFVWFALLLDEIMI